MSTNPPAPTQSPLIRLLEGIVNNAEGFSESVRSELQALLGQVKGGPAPSSASQAKLDAAKAAAEQAQAELDAEKAAELTEADKEAAAHVAAGDGTTAA